MNRRREAAQYAMIFPVQRAASGGKAAREHGQNFDLGVFCEEQNVLAALKQNEWRRKPQFEWYRGSFPSHVYGTEIFYLGGTL